MAERQKQDVNMLIAIAETLGSLSERIKCLGQVHNRRGFLL